MTALTSDPLGPFHALRSQLNEAVVLTEPGGPGRPWALFGSAVLKLHGLRERIGDIDVSVDHAVWVYLANHPMWEVRVPDPAHPPYCARKCGGLEVHAFYTWQADEPEVDLLTARIHAQLIHGWYATPLRLVRTHKLLSVQRHPGSEPHEKHKADILAIDRELRRVHADIPLAP